MAGFRRVLRGREVVVAEPGTRVGWAGLASLALGVLLGLATGAVCLALGVGGRGPESGLWLLLMPMVGAGVGALAGFVAWGTARLPAVAGRVAVAALATGLLTYAGGRLLLEGFDLAGVETGFAVFVGAVVAWCWPSWTRGPRRGVRRGAGRRSVGSGDAVVLLAALAGAIGTGCGPRAEVDATGRAATTLVGSWTSKPTPSQLGEIVHSYEFTGDGAYTMSLRFVQAGIPPMTQRGRYEARDGVLRLTGDAPTSRGPTEMRYAFEGDVLVLTESHGDAYRLHRR